MAALTMQLSSELAAVGQRQKQRGESSEKPVALPLRRECVRQCAPAQPDLSQHHLLCTTTDEPQLKYTGGSCAPRLGIRFEAGGLAQEVEGDEP